MNRTTLRALGTLTLVFLAGLLVSACQDDRSSLTDATSLTVEAGRLETASVSASHSGSSEGSGEDETSEDDESDDPSDDDDSDDESEDDDSDDDSIDDDDSDDDDSDDDDDDSDDEEGGEAEDSEVKGLFFGVEACPAADCVVALRIKDTLVAITAETEIVNQAAGDALVSPSDLELLVAGHPGLPMRAEGSFEGGVLVARKLRIEDEIRASGDVVPGAAGCDFGLAVRLEVLCFALAPGLEPPSPGSAVRVEGVVPGDFSLPFLATRIEGSDD